MNNKKVVVVLISLLMVFSLAACGGGSNNANNSNSGNEGATGNNASSEGQSPSAGEPVTLQYWTSDRHDQDYIKQAIDKFNETNEDNITVEMTVMSENFDQALDIAYASNQAPDLFRAKAMKTLLSKDYVEPINDYLTDDLKVKFSMHFVEGKSQFDGNVYSLAGFGQTLRLVYNKDLFELAGIKKAPTTLQELVDTAKKITEVGKKDGIYGFALNYKNPVSAFDRSTREIMQLMGDHSMGFQHETGEYDFTEYGEVIEYFKQMYEDGSIIPGAETLDIDPLRAQFAQGKIGMYMSYSTEPGVYQNQFPTQIEWGAALAPTIDGTIKGASEIISDGNWIAMSKKSTNKDAAWKFMQYMYSDEVLIGYHEAGLGISIVPHIVAQAKTPDMYAIEDFMPTKYDAMWPVFPWVAPEGQSYADAFFHYMLEGGDLEAIIADVNKRYNEAVKKEVEKGTVTVTPDPDFNAADLQGE